jgi:hypothetical protein
MQGLQRRETVAMKRRELTTPLARADELIE